MNFEYINNKWDEDYSVVAVLAHCPSTPLSSLL